MASLFSFVNLLHADENNHSAYKINPTATLRTYIQDYSFTSIYN